MRNSQVPSVPPTELPRAPVPATYRARELAMAERKRRQEELLDAALEETFPASDPVSVMRVI